MRTLAFKIHFKNLPIHSWYWDFQSDIVFNVKSTNPTEAGFLYYASSTISVRVVVLTLHASYTVNMSSVTSRRPLSHGKSHKESRSYEQRRLRHCKARPCPRRCCELYPNLNFPNLVLRKTWQPSFSWARLWIHQTLFILLVFILVFATVRDSSCGVGGVRCIVLLQCNVISGAAGHPPLPHIPPSPPPRPCSPSPPPRPCSTRTTPHHHQHCRIRSVTYNKM